MGLAETLGIEVEEATPERVVVSLEITPDHHQPAGIMHGGVSLVLAETAASIGGNTASPDDKMPLGLEINANHVRPVEEGVLRAEGTPKHIGSTTHVWNIELKNEDDQLVSTSRCTLAIRPIE